MFGLGNQNRQNAKSLKSKKFCRKSNNSLLKLYLSWLLSHDLIKNATSIFSWTLSKEHSLRMFRRLNEWFEPEIGSVFTIFCATKNFGEVLKVSRWWFFTYTPIVLLLCILNIPCLCQCCHFVSLLSICCCVFERFRQYQYN